MSNTRWFQLRDHIGVTAEQNLEPLVQEGLALATPIIRDGELVEAHQRVTIDPQPTLQGGDLARIVPGTRIIECADPIIAGMLLAGQKYEEIDPPTKTEIASAAKALTDAQKEAGTHEPDPAEKPEQHAEGHAKNEKGA